MCGIFGYAGTRPAAGIIVQGLKALTYRGYDSAGVAVQSGGKTFLKKGVGSITEVSGVSSLKGSVGMGHTRWATHGGVCEKNAHPFSYGGFTVVHNGIIENYAELKRELIKKGYPFTSDTDSEVIVMLLYENRAYPLLTALRKAAARLTGSYAIVALSDGEEGNLACIRKNSPLVVGLGKGEAYVSSDVPALPMGAEAFVSLGEGESALLSERGASFYRGETEIFPQRYPVSHGEESLEKREFAHFMRKEIEEVPTAAERTLRLLEGQKTALKRLFSGGTRILLFGCGTAYHAAVFGKYLLSRALKVPASVELASELRYAGARIEKDCVCIAVTQSGETADTLRMAKALRERGHRRLIALTNTPHSSITRYADVTMLTGAGAEIGVAATKSFSSQLTALLWLADALQKPQNLLCGLRGALSCALNTEAEIKALAHRMDNGKGVFFLGRDLDYPLALEGSLKLKEVSYLFSDGYAAGELKHGTLALIERGTPVVALLTQPRLAEKTLNALHEVACRGAEVTLLTQYAKYANAEGVERAILLPKAHPLMMPAVASVPLQLLAYHTALVKGKNPDRPRNLAKSVTVE